mgnify:CR=1 FL=1
MPSRSFIIFLLPIAFTTVSFIALLSCQNSRVSATDETCSISTRKLFADIRKYHERDAVKKLAYLPSQRCGPVGSGPRFIGLFTFPNSGTTWTLASTSIITKAPTATTYRTECKKCPVYPPGILYPASGHKTPLAGNRNVWTLAKSHLNYYFNCMNAISPVTQLLASTESPPSPLVFTSLVSKLVYTVPGIVRLVRNPFDNIVGRVKHHFEDLSPDNRTDVREEYAALLECFFEHDLVSYLSWHYLLEMYAMRSKTPMLTISYDRLIEDPHREMVKIVEFASRLCDDYPNVTEVHMSDLIHSSYSPVRDCPVHNNYYNQRFEDLIRESYEYFLNEREQIWVKGEALKKDRMQKCRQCLRVKGTKTKPVVKRRRGRLSVDPGVVRGTNE